MSLLNDDTLGYPIGLIFDLDENIVSATPIPDTDDQIAEGDNPFISSSTSPYLSQGQDGVVDYPRVFKGEGRLLKATAIQKEAWLKVFERIVDLNERFQKLKDKFPDKIKSKYLVAPIIITNATYDKDLFCQDVLIPFFGKRLILKLFRDLANQFFNLEDQLASFEEGETCNKGKFMGKCFEDFKEFFGVKLKQNWLLVDDNIANIEYMEKEGFSALLHPTNPTTRPPDVTYTTHGAKVFKTLHIKLDAAEDYLSKLEKKVSAQAEEKISVQGKLGNPS